MDYPSNMHQLENNIRAINATLSVTIFSVSSTIFEAIYILVKLRRAIMQYEKFFMTML